MDNLQKKVIEELKEDLYKSTYTTIKLFIDGKTQVYDGSFLQELLCGQIEPPVGVPSENSFGQWTDVKDKLPSYGEKVLVDIDNGYVILIGRRNTNGWSAFYTDGECLVNNPPEVNSEVTRWMPLPKP